MCTLFLYDEVSACVYVVISSFPLHPPPSPPSLFALLLPPPPLTLPSLPNYLTTYTILNNG